ncbi:MAG: UDP-N-acetylglucosamine--N-acetylmuramyl-(pentapeptide) pyrophosphoryl-undecaprenol N-acetylglucosamine transferase, partial [Opitutales bacterium]|nr:UDP-N-acetylglucosamine--N-acetylmuramyl-(pentapeptide) pyrophosphoryl-undecaprenol N-acetylglucosamine transferase [Opitutales bacterium]
MSKYLISCGGTGGHLAPGIAVGEALAKRGHEVSFIISEKAIDTRLCQKYTQFNFVKTPGKPFSANPIKFAKFLASQIRAVRHCKKLFAQNNADVAIAFGGFNSMGLALAAWLAKKPLVLHEANRKPGKAVRLFGFIATRVYLPHGVRIEQNKAGIVRQAGYPIRSEIFKKDETQSKMSFGFGKDANVLLVCGGSQGAASLNKWAKENFADLAREGIDVF